MTIRRREGRKGWLVQVEVDGQRKRQQVPDRWAAERAERDLRRALEAGRDYLGLGEALRAYTATLRTRAKAGTVRSAEFHGGVLEEHLGHTFNVAELRQADLDTLVAKLRDADWRDTSINGALRILRAAVNHSEREGALTKAPFVCLLRETRKLPTALTLPQVELLVSKAEPCAALAIQLAAHAGLRHQEIVHLTLADVAGDVVRVTAKDGWTPKAHQEREIPKNRILRAALGAWLGQQGACGTPHAPCEVRLAEGQPVQRVAPASTGRRGFESRTSPYLLGRSHLFVPVREAFQAAELWDPERKPGLHMLRRTFATRLAAKGVPLVTIMRLGGWSSLEVVQRYLSSDTDVERAAVAALEE
jgi:integrase